MANNMVDVSVVLPTRNRPLLLKRALTSVFSQDYKGTFECIVVDDGELSGAEYIKKIAVDAGAIFLPINRAVGGGAARNAGILKASGTVIAFLDDDDTWENDKLSKQIISLQSTDFGLSYTGIFITDNRGRKRYSFRKPGYVDHFKAIMRKNFIGTTSTIIAGKAALVSVGGFDERLPALQDYDLYIRILRTSPAIWISDPLTSYYSNDTGDKISGSRTAFRTAASILMAKYRDDPYGYLLKRSLFKITLLKCIRSRRFLFETIRTITER